MRAEAKIRMAVDVCLTVLLPILMAEIMTGQELHEWLGVAMAVFFIFHHGLNWKWWRNVGKGGYTWYRCTSVMLNLFMLADILALVVSGIMMSGFVFDGLSISGGMILSRRCHLFASHWGLVLMSLHMGLHWNMAVSLANRLRKGKSPDSMAVWLCRGIGAAVALFGIYAFIRQNMVDYLLLRTAFVFWDETKSAVTFFAEVFSMIGLFISIGYYGSKILKGGKCGQMKQKVLKGVAFLVPVLLCMLVMFWIGSGSKTSSSDSWNPASEDFFDGKDFSDGEREEKTGKDVEEQNVAGSLAAPEDGFVMITGGTFAMGSPESEAWRSEDEQQHIVTVSDFYISPYEVTQADYEALTGTNPSSFNGGNLPVDSVSWLDAVLYCNLLSEQSGLMPAYQIEGESVSWNRNADGYRLPTEAEWEYACRAGTVTPFHTEDSISPEESNYWGNYPYMIEDNYFEQGNLETRPGTSRYETVAVDSFEPNGYGLYNMHGNVGEWVWDLYGEYGAEEQTDPAGAGTGNLHISRGGGWNDFAKNLRSAYRATSQGGRGAYNIGFRLVRGAVSDGGVITSGQTAQTENTDGKVLIAYFSGGGNTRGIAEEIASQTGADLFEITCVEPYSDNYNTVLEEAQKDQNVQARPELASHVEDMEQYDTILLGYSNWWASIPMPVASFLEEYDFAGKTIVPFCSHGGGRFGQSLTAIAKLAPDANIGEGLAINYSGGASMASDVGAWLEANDID